MKLLLISDVHGDFQTMEKIIEANQDADFKFFMGDFQTNKYAEQELANKFDFVVMGNNDHPGISDKELLVELDGIKIYMTHGDRFFTFKEYVSKDKLAKVAEQHGATLALHGHDHKASISQHGSVTVFNPGSPSYPRFGSKASYGIIEIDNGEITRIENILV